MKFRKSRTSPEFQSHLEAEGAKRLLRATARGRDERAQYPESEPVNEPQAKAPARKRLFWTPDELTEAADDTRCPNAAVA